MYLIYIVIKFISLLIFYKSPIKYSKKNILLNFNYKHLYICFIVLILVFTNFHYFLNHKKFIFIPDTIISIIAIVYISTPTITDDGSLNPPPKHISKSILLHIINIILLIILIVYHYISNNNINYIEYLMLTNTIMIITIFKLKKYVACNYLLPVSWNNI